MTENTARNLYESCPLCSSSNFVESKRGDCSQHALYIPKIPAEIIWLNCKDCGHEFTNGYFTDEIAGEIFQKTQPSQRVGYDAERQRVITSRIVSRIAEHVPPPGAWLDVGFGNGAVLFSAQEWGYEPVGIDLRESEVTALASVGIESHCADIATLNQNERFTVISMADVLEHMPFPKNGLLAARRLLKPDGALFVSMPNAEIAAWRLLDANNINPYYGELEHFHNFSKSRLYQLLESCGLEPVNYAVSERYRLGMEVLARVKQ